MRRGIVYSAALIMFIVASCSVDELDLQSVVTDDAKPAAQEIIITAGFDESGSTKTILNNEGKVEWLPSDEMSLFSAGEMAKFTSINTESSRSANFRGVISFITGANEGSDPEAFVYGLYPYDADATMSAGVLTTTIPSSQVGYPDSFGDDLALSVAKSASLNLNFKNAYSGIDFEFSETGYTSVTLSSNNGELIAGTVKVSFDSNGVPQTEVVSGSSSITVTAPGGGSFQTGTRYYIVCAPQTMEGGFTLTAHKSTGYSRFSVTSRQVFARNTFKYVTGNLNERSEFTPVIAFADNAVKALCVANWDTDGDEELSYEEAAAVTRLGSVFHDNNEIEYFNEFRYFVGITSMGALSNDGTGQVTNSFSLCTNLKSICLPTSLTNIGGGAFYYCTALEEVEIPVDITNIWYNPFVGCNSLRTFIDSHGNRDRILYKQGANSRTIVAIASGDTTPLEISTAQGAPGMSVISIGGGALECCNPSLQNVRIYMDELKSIGNRAFSNTQNTHIIFDFDSDDPVYRLTTIQEGAFQYSALQSYDIPETVTYLGDYCFRGCTALQTLYVHNNITTIPTELCNGCTSLNRMWLPSSITSIGDLAFKNCTSIGDFYVTSTTPPTLIGTPFVNTTCTFYVPSSAVNTYKNHTQWRAYASRIVGY